MIELLEKIEKYAYDKGFIGTLSLIIENDGSGFLIENVFDCLRQEPVFVFESLEDLYKEVGYNKT